MKALTLFQPWAWLIVTPDPERPWFPLKDVENRVWRLPKLFTLPQRIYVHASKTMPEHSFKTLRNVIRSKHIELPPKGALTRGAIIGEVTIMNATRISPSAWAENGKWGFELMYPTVYETPIPCKGQQRLWEPPKDIMEPRYKLADFDVCECSDYYRDHDPETGRCRMPDNMAHGMKPCLAFKLWYAATEIPEPFRSK